MSRTLFWYVLRDLLRIFFTAAAVLAGIMAFGGLLKPLTEHGLSAGQAAKVLVYFLPATQTYALPIAALFATTMVYGRLSADNELTACRASGISNLSMTMPALVLGLSLSLVSIVCLCFVAPHYMLKAEKVVFSNIAEVVKKKIDRSHQLQLGGMTIFANAADLAHSDGDAQVVILHGVMFVKYESPQAAKNLELPTMFWTADKATAFIRPVREEVEFTAQLEGGMKIDATSGAEAASNEAVFGPVIVPSPMREKTQFMDIQRLKDLTLNPEKSQKVRDQINKMARGEIERAYLEQTWRELMDKGRVTFKSDEGDFVLRRGDEKIARPAGGEINLLSQAGTQQVRLENQRGSRTSTDKAGAASVQVEAMPRGPSDPRVNRLRVAITLKDAVLDVGEEYSPHHDVFRGRRFVVPLPADLAGVQEKAAHEVKAKVKARRMGELGRELDDLEGKVRTEIHGRASFSVSCLILVMVGCALGMMFRSGDFITSFALSAVPALLCMALVSVGGQVGGSSPKSLPLGIGIIWAGNGITLVIAMWLLWKLQRQ